MTITLPGLQGSLCGCVRLSTLGSDVLQNLALILSVVFVMSNNVAPSGRDPSSTRTDTLMLLFTF